MSIAIKRLQNELKDCGVSCLEMIIKYYGGYVKRETLIEMTKRNKRDYDKTALNSCDTYSYKIYCSYAYIETDEIDTEEFPIAVMTYKPKYSKRTTFIFVEPIWQFIADIRTLEQQKFIEANFDKLNELFIDFAHAQGYLKEVN